VLGTKLFPTLFLPAAGSLHWSESSHWSASQCCTTTLTRCRHHKVRVRRFDRNSGE